MRKYSHLVSLVVLLLLFGASCSVELIPPDPEDLPESGVTDSVPPSENDDSENPGDGSDDGDSSEGNNDMYFPPSAGDSWEIIEADDLGWDINIAQELFDYLESQNTRAFLVLYKGHIVLEEYYGNEFETETVFNSDSEWYWASAGKSFTAFLVGVAQQQALLDISEPTSTYLGDSWSSLTPEQQEKIRVIDHLRMTTGLDEDVKDNTPNDKVDDDCTDPECLQYKADAGTRWVYHNAPYNLLDEIMFNASGIAYTEFSRTYLESQIGMTGTWRNEEEYNKIYWSTGRDAARFGLLMLNRGNWNGKELLNDETFFNEMISTSQSFNRGYGYLWWLNKNGFTSYMYTGNAPGGMYSAVGLNGQFINVVPELELVVVRLGGAPANGIEINEFHNEMWMLIKSMMGD